MPAYSLTLKNNAAQAWKFFVYQQLPDAPSPNVFSLAWLVSPFHIAPGAGISFQWTNEYGFVWSSGGKLAPGVQFNATQYVAANPAEGSTIEFANANSTPAFGAVSTGPTPGTLVVRTTADVPSNSFTMGVGMSGAAVFTVAAGPNMNYVFNPRASYWIAAGENVQAGSVLDVGAINQNLEVSFPPNVYALTYTLEGDNRWAQVG